MRPRTYSTEGIILAKVNYSEADRIMVVFSKDFGKLSLIAKSVRKPESRKRGNLEVFNHIKFAAARGKNLDIITEVENINSYSKIRKSLKRMSVAYFIAETIGRITTEDEENQVLFLSVLNALSELETDVSLRRFRLEFTEELLKTLGYWPKSKKMDNPDKELETVLEKSLNTVRIGKIISK
jgi:DNA repair protein RecO (recombination protein O)